MRIPFVLLFFSLSVGCAHTETPNESARLVGRTQQHMGTLIEVRVPQTQLKLSEVAFQIFADLDSKLSTYQPQSEISRLNRGEDVELSAETLEVLQVAGLMKMKSEGYFDIQKGQSAGPRDLGGIGKGFAVDKARKALEQQGVQQGLIAASGDIFCIHACQLAIRDPFGGALPLGHGELKSGGWAISTSGRDLRDHIQTPGSKIPPQHWLSVTLISRWTSNAELDAWATALFAMPENKALNRLGSLDGIEYFVVTSQGNIHTSPGWLDSFTEFRR